MKAFILCDYEGTTGTVSWDEEQKLGPAAMAQDANAAIAGLREGGFTEFVVRDFHASGLTMNPSELDPAAVLIRGSSMPFPYGLGPDFDAMVFVGAHAKAGTACGVMSHTMNNRTIFEVRLNGREIGEIGGFALLAGYFDVPLVLVSGDQAACDEARSIVGDLETAVVKTGVSRHCAVCLHPSTARELIRSKAAAAAKRLGDFKPLKWTGPFTLDITYNYANIADAVLSRLGGERIADRTVRVQRETIPEVFECLARGFE
ncbi:MAG: M55 family metallopeptidase [Armatimonadota bacterium]|nr:M55 family metallopeptidase [Armatimonadota bacterium]